MRAIASSMSPHVTPQQGPTPIFSAATADGITAVQTVSAAAATLPTTPTAARVKGYLQIKQYLLSSAAQLTSCSSPTATAPWLTSSMLPHVSLGASQLLKPAYVDTTTKLRPEASVLALRAAGANQLLKPAPATPRSYGRRHRSWHAYFKHAQRAAPRETACTPRSSTCVAPRASAWAP
jgi:hypothetical protein